MQHFLTIKLLSHGQALFGIGNGTQPLHASLASSLKQTLAHQEPPYPLKRNRLRTGINCFHSFSHMNKCVSTAGTTKELPLVLLQKPSTQSVLFPYSPAVSFKTSSGSHGNDYADFFSKAGASMNSVMVFRPLFSVIAKTHYTLDSTTNGDITFFSSNLSSSCSFFFGGIGSSSPSLALWALPPSLPRSLPFTTVISTVLHIISRGELLL